MQKWMLTIAMLLLLGVAACVEQADEPIADPADPAEELVEPATDPAAVQQSFREPAAPALQLETQQFSCRVVAWTCTSTAQCEAMCGGPGTGVCNFRTLCCGCLL